MPVCYCFKTDPHSFLKQHFCSKLRIMILVNIIFLLTKSEICRLVGFLAYCCEMELNLRYRKDRAEQRQLQANHILVKAERILHLISLKRDITVQTELQSECSLTSCVVNCWSISAGNTSEIQQHELKTKMTCFCSINRNYYNKNFLFYFNGRPVSQRVDNFSDWVICVSELLWRACSVFCNSFRVPWRWRPFLILCMHSFVHSNLMGLLYALHTNQIIISISIK